ncbi:MAG: 30S ribosomal protein S2 [Victivallaceae bacterium]
MSISVKELMEAGAHFGHQKRRWNPRMKRFIFEEKSGLYIIDLAKTLNQIRMALPVIKKTVESHKSILFVGTKKQAKNVIKESAEACGEFYVCERWLGGMLTNMSTIRQSIKTLEDTEKKLSATDDNDLTKKELSLLSKKQQKLDRNLSGIRYMKNRPGLLIVVDPSYERIAVAEATKLGIPVCALVDTNCDPTPITYVIPCNDDSLKSIKVIISAIRDVITDTKKQMGMPMQRLSKESNETGGPQEETLLTMKYEGGQE